MSGDILKSNFSDQFFLGNFSLTKYVRSTFANTYISSHLTTPAIIRAAMFCDTCLAIFLKKWGLTDEEWSHSVDGPHHNDLIGLRRSASQNCRICKAIWLECIVGFGKEDWTNAKVSTLFKVVHQSASIEHAIKQGRRMELQIDVSRTLGCNEIRRLMLFDLLPCISPLLYIPYLPPLGPIKGIRGIYPFQL